MRAMWVDSHCHIQERYETDGLNASEAIEEASGAGVIGLVCIGTDPESSRQAVDLVKNLRESHGEFGLWCTAGLHPHDASRGPEAVGAIEALIDEADRMSADSVVAVGECGLDYHYDHSSRVAQRAAFEAQIDLARKLRRTLVVHSRNAWDDTFDILRSTGMPERVVIHCFTGGPPEASRCLDLGAYLSFSGIVTFKGAPEVREAAALCPAERLLVETDTPFLAPVPYRGKPNRPAWVAVVGEAVAEARGEKTEDLARTSTEAFRAAFALGEAGFG
jgi:TatD DNase family protein